MAVLGCRSLVLDKSTINIELTESFSSPAYTVCFEETPINNLNIGPVNSHKTWKLKGSVLETY